MGIDYRGIAVIGQRVKARDMVRVERLKAFDHDHPEDWSHDPKTGEKLWREVSYPRIDQYDLDRLNLQVFGLGYHEFIGVGAETGSSLIGGDPAMLRLSLVEPVMVLERVRELLEPLGVFDLEQFGLWALLREA